MKIDYKLWMIIGAVMLVFGVAYVASGQGVIIGGGKPSLISGGHRWEALPDINTRLSEVTTVDDATQRQVIVYHQSKGRLISLCVDIANGGDQAAVDNAYNDLIQYAPTTTIPQASASTSSAVSSAGACNADQTECVTKLGKVVCCELNQQCTLSGCVDAPTTTTTLLTCDATQIPCDNTIGFQCCNAGERCTAHLGCQLVIKQ
jgi:hypothetical protein